MTCASLGKRAGGLLFALGLQGLFALFLIYSLQVARAPNPAREMMLLLRPRARPEPIIIDARQKAQPAPATPPLPASNNTITLPPAAPQAAITGVGRMLFGCAPENLDSLPPEARDACRRTHQAVAAPSPDLLKLPDEHVKDKAYWQEEDAKRRFAVALCPLGGTITHCMLVQQHVEYLRAQAARERLAAAKADALKRAEQPRTPYPQKTAILPATGESP